ncbi:MAG: FtsX-like permease family protein, partial [Acidobacteriota bacterium]
MTAVWRSLKHHGRMNLAIAAGAAVATAVLTGALLVGDSVRGSLRDLVLDRLGGIDQALAAQRFVGEDLADRLAVDDVAPAILLQGSFSHADNGSRASDVNVQGADERFFTLFGRDDTPSLERDGPFPTVILNASLARALDATEGDDVLLNLARWSEVPRASLLGRKETGDVVETVRLRVGAIIADEGIGRFDLDIGQEQALVAYIALDELQDALEQEGTVNALVVTTEGTALDDPDLEDALRDALRLEDLGLSLRQGDDRLSLESDQFVLRPSIVSAAEDAAGSTGATMRPLLTYIANELRVGAATVPYSSVAALGGDISDDRPPLLLIDGTAAPLPTDDQILINSWAAEQLDATVGDELTMTYFEIDAREQLTEVEHTFTVSGIIGFEALGGDPSVVQPFPGIGDSDNMADWDPPFPVDLSLIRPVDEEYWDLHRATPKAWVGLETGQELWRTRWGKVNTIHITPPADTDLGTFATTFGDAVLDELPPAAFGLVFRPVKELGLEAATGPTDFASLFLGFSWFLIASSALLTLLLFRLAIEQRADEIGLLLAVGYPLGSVRRQLLGEGLIIAVLGGLVGIGGAVGYAAAMIAGLNTWWQPAVGTSSLALHITPASVLTGFVISTLVVLATIWWTVRSVGKVPITSLLRRVVAPPRDPGAGKRARTIALASLLFGIGLMIGDFANDRTIDPMSTMLVGTLVLIGGLAGFAYFLASTRISTGGRAGAGALFRLAAGNGGRNRGRSVLATTLVAVATFMIVTVAAFQIDPTRGSLGRDSGAGGFALVAEADVPIHQDLDDDDARFELGIPESDSAEMEGVSILGCRLLPGDDTSCLNLYQPTRPRVVGVPPALIERAAFRFQDTASDVENPWTLLQDDLGEGVIPAIGDANSLQWVLKKKLGDSFLIEDGTGEPLELRIVGTLATSIFQSELLIAEENFVRHFPDQEGFAY